MVLVPSGYYLQAAEFYRYKYILTTGCVELRGFPYAIGNRLGLKKALSHTVEECFVEMSKSTFQFTIEIQFSLSQSAAYSRLLFDPRMLGRRTP